MSTPSPVTLDDQIRASMAATNDLFNLEVFGKRNFDALDKIYTETATILPPGAPIIRGREAIKQFWSSLVTSVNAQSAVLGSVEVTHTGDGIVEIGKATLTIQPDDQPPAQMEIKYVVFWRQEEDVLKWHVDIWNANS